MDYLIVGGGGGYGGGGGGSVNDGDKPVACQDGGNGRSGIVILLYVAPLSALELGRQTQFDGKKPDQHGDQR